VLHVVKLNAGYGELHVLFDVEVEASDRKITTLVGANGSGKSTLLKAVFGLATVYSGKIMLDDQDLIRIPPHQKARMKMAYLPQVENIFTNLTVQENLKIAGYALNEASYIDGLELALETFPEMKTLIGRRARTLSGGERQFLAISTALVRKAKLLMLDEPTAQLSPKLADTMFDRIVSLRDHLGLGIILVEQDVRKALGIGDNAYALVNGSVAFHGKAQELIEHENFERLCMGVC
jgi:branched-chain amino acid transport system ATP-binding protein